MLRVTTDRGGRGGSGLGISNSLYVFYLILYDRILFGTIYVIIFLTFFLFIIYNILLFTWFAYIDISNIFFN